MSDKKIEIYIAVHKKANVLKREGYIPLHVGAEGKEDLGFVKDNTGDNISCKILIIVSLQVYIGYGKTVMQI